MSKTILVVEDEGILALLLQNLLSHLGYIVAGPLTKGEEAISCLAEREIDLILMDIELAGTLNGIETARRIQETSDIPVIFLTGFSEAPLIEQAKSVSPYGYLIKPVSERELAAALAMALHRHTLDRQVRISRSEIENREADVRRQLQTIIAPEGAIGSLQLGDIIDPVALQTMMEQFHRLTGIGIGIVDMEGNILVGVGWQDICTKFHRCHPGTLENCLASAARLKEKIPAGTYRDSRCKNNLWNLMTPIEIGGRHVGNVCLGQFFYDDESPDYEFFRNHAKKHGFDEAEYLEALDRVPRRSRVQVATTMEFYASLARMISTLSYSAINLSRALAQKNKALRQLDESRSFQISLLETIPIPVYYKDAGGRYLGFNKAGEIFYHRTKAQMIGKTAFDLFPPELAQSYNDMESELLVRKGSHLYETTFTPLHGISRDVIVQEASLTDAQGEIIGIIGAMLDITERKQAEKQLKENQKFMEATTMMIPDVVYLFDIPEQRHIYFNKELTNLPGYSNDEIKAAGVGLVLNVIHPEDLVQVKKHMEFMAHTSDDLQHEVEYRMKDKQNTYRWLYCRERVYLRDDAHQPKILFGIVQDITERKMAEEEKSQLQNQLIQAQKMEAIGTLAGGIAHDFNNILGAILGYAEMVREDSPAESITARDLDQIILASNRAKELVKQILAFSRQVDMAKIPLQPAIIVREAIMLLRSSLPTTIAIKQDIDADTAPIFADPTQIHQILMNICTNAFHAMEVSGGTLCISLTNIDLAPQELAGLPHIQPGRFVRLSIGDTGQGIVPEIKERIFDPYFTTKAQGKGTGMGLAIAHGIVKGHGGFITCESRFGEGTVFNIALPALIEYAAAENQPSKSVPDGSEHILFIDDEVMLAEMAQVMLKRLGYAVTVKSDSLDAMATFASQPEAFDLVITDQTMPGMTGMDLAQRMLQIRPDIPIILCTGYSNLVSEEKAKATGIRGFALKPLAKKDIAVLIRKVLDKTPHASETVTD